MLYGRLLGYSPVILGFEKQNTERATLYYHKGENISDYKMIDSLMALTEHFHKLKFNYKPKIIICKSDDEMRRLTGSAARFITQSIFGNIFISAKANREQKEQKIHLDTYLKHELSHSLLFQNMSFIKALTYPQWFMEGLAVYSSNQFGIDGYLTKQEIYKKIKEGYFVKPKDWGTVLSSKGKTVKECNLKDKYYFIYSEYGCIMDNLIEIYGKEKFIIFLKKSLQTDDFYVLFKQTFEKDFSEYLNEYKTRIKADNN